MRLGLITIGQSPREDIDKDILPLLKRIEVIECGALNGLSDKEISELKPEKYTLVTKLRDEREVKVDRDKIIKRVQTCVSELEDKVDIIGLLCTGEFPPFRSKKILIEPSSLLLGIVRAIFPEGKLGIFIPSEDQMELTIRKWNRDAIIRHFSPYSGKMEDLAKSSESMKDTGLIVMDCFGYNFEMKSLVAERTQRPVLLPRSLLASVVSAL
jgi:protein AroM